MPLLEIPMLVVPVPLKPVFKITLYLNIIKNICQGVF